MKKVSFDFTDPDLGIPSDSCFGSRVEFEAPEGQGIEIDGCRAEDFVILPELLTTEEDDYFVNPNYYYSTETEYHLVTKHYSKQMAVIIAEIATKIETPGYRISRITAGESRSLIERLNHEGMSILEREYLSLDPALDSYDFISEAEYRIVPNVLGVTEVTVDFSQSLDPEFYLDWVIDFCERFGVQVITLDSHSSLFFYEGVPALQAKYNQDALVDQIKLLVCFDAYGAERESSPYHEVSKVLYKKDALLLPNYTLDLFDAILFDEEYESIYPDSIIDQISEEVYDMRSRLRQKCFPYNEC